MKNNKFFILQELYSNHLETIEGINFTPREIDVIACLLSARGTSKISSILAVSAHTVITHIRNIMLKLECSSREGIIDFVELSHKSAFFKRYYENLVLVRDFEKSLKEISKVKERKDSPCLVIYGNYQKLPKGFFQHLENHLKQAGLSIIIGKLSSTFNPRFHPNKVLLLFINNENIDVDTNRFEEFESVELSDNINYYFSVFAILEKLFLAKPLDSIVSAFKKTHEHLSELDSYRFDTREQIYSAELEKSSSPGPILKHILNQPLYFVKHKMAYGGIALILISLMCLGIFHYPTNRSLIRSDLAVPTESVFLNRSELMEQIEDGFKGKGGIQTIALVGIGGSGKTTTARQYAHQQKAPLIWEINAESKSSLIESFENLAHALAKTEEDKKTLGELIQIKNSSERETRFVAFVKGRLKAHLNWFLIFDNVEKFTDIQKYFPYDFETWGEGKVIITTRDANIENNKYLNNTIKIGELNSDQKFVLFSKIMNGGKNDSFSPSQKKDAISFLEKIPPYPLDITITAYYLKSTAISYSRYLDMLMNDNQYFSKIQENLLKEAGDYIKTRYSIVSLSCQKLIDTQKDFADLLFFISILDSQNIPIEILKKYKKYYIVDDFIHNLKKYSLITNSSQTAPRLISGVSIHRSTQAIALTYFQEELNLEKKRELVQGFVHTLIGYADRALDEQNFSLINPLLHHYEKFLNHDDLLSEDSKNSLTLVLAYMYYESGSDFLKTKKYLERGLKSLNEGYNKGDATVIRPLIYLGRTYRDSGNFEDAKKVFEKTLPLIKQHPDLQSVLGSTLVYLGTTYRDLGNYGKAIELLGEALLILKQNLPNYNLKYAEALAYMGLAHWMSGDYVNAQCHLEQSCALYKKFFPENKIKIGWSCSCLANVYGDLGYDERARDLAEQSIDILRPYNKTNPLGFALLFLGNIRRKLGNYDKAYELTNEGVRIIQEIQPDNQIRLADAFTYLGVLKGAMGDYKTAEKTLKYCLSIYEKEYGNKHVKYAEISKELGVIYLREGHLDKAESLFQQSLTILKRNNHAGAYLVLENLSDLYLKKSNLAAKNGDNQQEKGFRDQAIYYLKQALEFVKTHFPSNAHHIKRIQSKLNKFTE